MRRTDKGEFNEPFADNSKRIKRDKTVGAIDRSKQTQ